MSDITQEEFEKDVTINNSSAWHLSECLKSHPKTEGKYHKKLSDAIKVLDDLTFSLEITTAEIAETIINQAEIEGKSIPASGKEFVLKVMIKKDERYQKLRKEVIEAKYVVSVLRGFVKGMDSRGYNLSQICKLEEKKMRGEPTYYGQEQVEYGKSKRDQFKSVDTRVQEASELLDFGEPVHDDIQ